MCINRGNIMKFSKSLLVTTLAATLSLPGFSAMAEEQSPIIVTATRTAQTVDDSLASVTVITREDIEKLQAKDLRAVLSGIVGIDISNAGGFGKQTSLYMRGTNTGHTLVLIDGVQIGSATLGQVAYQDIPVEQIERIEIVRGPRASLYGSEAIGGVIQIFTRKPTETMNVYFSAGTGSEQTHKLTAGISGKTNQTSFSLNASSFETDGINAKRNNNPDNDGYNRESASLNIKQQLNKTDYLEASFLGTNGENQYDGTFDIPGSTTDYASEINQEVFGLKGVFNATADWQIKLSANQSQDKSNEFIDSVKTDEFNTRRKSFLWQNDIVITEANLFTFGLEKQDTSISGTSNHSKKSRENKAAFIQNNWTADKSTLLVSLRADDNEAFGNHTTGNISWGYDFGYNAHLTLSAGTGFKAPTFNDLYWPVSAFSQGNPNVLPEESESFEIGLKQKNVQINLYKTTIKNLIDWDNATGIWMPSNIDNAVIRGIEFQLSLLLDGWDTKLQLSLLDPRNIGTGQVLNNRSRESVRLDFNKDFGKYTLGSTLKAQSKRHGFTTVSGYALVDLRASYKINKKWILRGNIGNVLDKRYEVNSGYNTLERNVFISLNYQY